MVHGAFVNARSEHIHSMPPFISEEHILLSVDNMQNESRLRIAYRFSILRCILNVLKRLIIIIIYNLSPRENRNWYIVI